jgi:hypothetical protein
MAHPLDKPTYDRMQALLQGLVSEAVSCGACQLSIAHAFAPLAVDLLLQMHPPETVKDILGTQADLIDAAKDAQRSTQH